MTKQQDPPVDTDLADALTEAECYHLLRSRTFGRIGVTSGGLPVILPVRYFYEADAITFRTRDGTKLRAARDGDVLAFQVDAYDSDTCAGWSVLVLGRASLLSTKYEYGGRLTLDPIRDSQPLDHYVRLSCELVSGRVLSRDAGE